MKKILIIDDEFILRQGLLYLMDWESFGYTIIGQATNGQEGLDLLSKLNPDIILCDVVMPVLDGVDFVKKIQQISGPPVIILSNYDEYNKVRNAFQYGAADYILKSNLTQEVLLSALERVSRNMHPQHKSDVNTFSENKTFPLLLRQVLDGYATKPYTELETCINATIKTDMYQLLFVDSLGTNFNNIDSFSTTIKELFPTLPILCSTTTHNHVICLIGLYSEHLDNHWIHVFLDRLNLKLADTPSALSIPFSDISEIKTITERMINLTHYSILYDTLHVFYEGFMDINKSNIIPQLNENFLLKLTCNQTEEALSILFSTLNNFKNTNSVNPVQFKKFIEHTFFISICECKKLTMNTSSLSKLELMTYKQLDNAKTFLELKEILTSAYNSLNQIYLTDNKLDPIVANLQGFLESNYQKQVTLYEASKSLHMNYSYLSTYISNNTGKHFNELLNEIRIRHAKKLLCSTLHSISHISEEIGYTDQSYFGKVFKKNVGLTPLQYRFQETGHK